MKKAEDSAKPFTVLLAGNPNVGKSTVFNALTGLHQHTGNWTGKTVTSSKGCCTSEAFELCANSKNFFAGASSSKEKRYVGFLSVLVPWDIMLSSLLNYLHEMCIYLLYNRYYVKST